MLGDKKDIQQNLKDPAASPQTDSSGMSVTITYPKTQKLITALYMVTDILDKEEPLRNKLRTLGVEIISDTYGDPFVPTALASRIREVMSFLDIASAMNIISHMNCDILRKEFLELEQAIKELEDRPVIINKKINLTDFFENSPLEGYSDLDRSGVDKSIPPPPKGYSSRGELNSHRHQSLGIQQGKTLLKAIKDMSVLSGAERTDKNSQRHISTEQFDALKRQRREDIVNIIKIVGGNATIKDIKDKAKTLPPKTGSLATCGEKTLQRELVSMVHNGVLKKTGEKRWSRYFVI